MRTHDATQAKKRAFLRAYAETATVTHAARAAQIERRTHYHWLEDDPEYAAAFEEAGEAAIDKLEREAQRRAVEGYEEPVYYQGERVGAVRKYSDVLLIFLLKGARPHKYRDNLLPEGATGGIVFMIHGPDKSELGERDIIEAQLAKGSPDCSTD